MKQKQEQKQKQQQKGYLVSGLVVLLLLAVLFVPVSKGHAYDWENRFFLGLQLKTTETTSLTIMPELRYNYSAESVRWYAFTLAGNVNIKNFLSAGLAYRYMNFDMPFEFHANIPRLHLIPRFRLGPFLIVDRNWLEYRFFGGNKTGSVLQYRNQLKVLYTGLAKKIGLIPMIWDELFIHEERGIYLNALGAGLVVPAIDLWAGVQLIHGLKPEWQLNSVEIMVQYMHKLDLR